MAFDKSLEINSEYADAWNNKGVALDKLGKYEEAIKAYGKALEINQKNTTAHSNLGELFFNLGNLEDASKKVKDLLAIDENRAHALALHLQGRIKIEELDYNSAAESFKKAISLDMGNPLLLLWDAYANYLTAEFTSNSKGEGYQEKIVSIIRKLERAEKLSKKHGEEETRAYILYLLGYFYYKSKDIFTAKEKLEECVRKSRYSIKSTACELLENIRNYQIRPNWMYWWLASPLHCGIKIIVFIILLLSIFASFFLHPFIPLWFPSLQINLTLHIFFIAFLIFILISPSVERFKVKEFEVEMHSTPPVEFVLSPATMEEKIEKLETHLKR
jgi:tetratricopeptide (TPR) repeat protein